MLWHISRNSLKVFHHNRTTHKLQLAISSVEPNSHLQIDHEYNHSSKFQKYYSEDRIIGISIQKGN